jgi:hypothetical protein
MYVRAVPGTGVESEQKAKEELGSLLRYTRRSSSVCVTFSLAVVKLWPQSLCLSTPGIRLLTAFLLSTPSPSILLAHSVNVPLFEATYS